MSDPQNPTPEEVRSLAAKLKRLGESIPRGRWAAHELKRLAVDLEERAQPGSHVPFRFTLAPLVRLRVELSDAMREEFEDFVVQGKIDYSGGGGSGSDGGLSMSYYFASSEHLGRATAWLRGRGAEHTTDDALEAEREAKWQAMRGARSP